MAESILSGTRERRRAKAEAMRTLRFVGITRYQVLYQAEGRERRSPWFSDRNRAHTARRLLAAKHGQAIVMVD